MSGCRVLAVFWIGCGRGIVPVVVVVVRLLRGRWCGSGWMIWSRSCLVRRSVGVVEVPLFRTCGLDVRGQVAECKKLDTCCVWGSMFVVELGLENGAETEADGCLQTDQPSW